MTKIVAPNRARKDIVNVIAFAAVPLHVLFIAGLSCVLVHRTVSSWRCNAEEPSCHFLQQFFSERFDRRRFGFRPFRRVSAVSTSEHPKMEFVRGSGTRRTAKTHRKPHTEHTLLLRSRCTLGQSCAVACNHAAHRISLGLPFDLPGIA